LAIIKKVEIQIDLTQPTEEIVNVISLVLGYFPQQSEEILLALDQAVGESLALIEKNKREKE
jgi:mevalonate kinase